MQDQSFFARLFDFSFTSFITTSIVKVIYGLAIFFSCIAALVFIIAGFQAHALVGILFLLLAPVIFLLYVMASRVALEVVMVIFRIAENTGRMAGGPPLTGAAAEGGPGTEPMS